MVTNCPCNFLYLLLLLLLLLTAGTTDIKVDFLTRVLTQEVPTFKCKMTTSRRRGLNEDIGHTTVFSILIHLNYT